MIDNSETLNTIAAEEYPALFNALNKYRASLWRRLTMLIQYQQSKKGAARTDQKGRQWFFVSFAWLIAQYGGSAQSWSEAIHYLAAIGLLMIIKPTSKTFASAMVKSWERANEKKQRSVLWYHIPEFTPQILSVAEERIEQIQAAGINRAGLHKGGLIKSIGQEEANHVFIDGRGIGKREIIAEAGIRKSIKKQIQEKGYAMKEKAVKDGAKALRRSFHSELDLQEALWYTRQLWKNQSRYILKRLGCTYKRPTAKEKENFKLVGNGWIITMK